MNTLSLLCCSGLLCLDVMGAESRGGGGGTRFPGREISGSRPPRN